MEILSIAISIAVIVGTFFGIYKMYLHLYAGRLYERNLNDINQRLSNIIEMQNKMATIKPKQKNAFNIYAFSQ